MTPDEADLVRRLDDAWAGKGEYADGDVDLLRGLCGEAKAAVRHLAGRACVAPAPEGAPRYAELAEALREVIDEGFPALSADMAIRYGVPQIQVSMKGYSRARALLSRLPQPEGTDR